MSTSDPAKIVSHSVVVPAPAQDIFNLLADPRRHSEIDGSGSVKAARVNAPERLSLGAKFGMDMRIVLPYKMTNEVVEFEEGKQIGWRHFGGHIWRYILEPVEGGTKVTEQFDWNTNKSPLMLKVMKAVDNNSKSIQKTLDNLVKRFS
ncbi:MAG: SRPBCC family protein [Ilumatobacteraceae bacterium]